LGQGILLDSPTAHPALGFDEIARGFASIIEHSDPPFAISIFGGWGSGKTTLMKTIKKYLTTKSLVSVEFNAWRFEREPQLLAPLLDTVRAAVVSWAERPDREEEKGKTIREAAARIGSVVRALATGLSVQAGLPGAVTLGYDAGAALKALSETAKPESAQSPYFAAFQELEEAFGKFKVGGIQRVVIFVDDLDRCLPENALQLFESMKLFFDLEGFIFVVGMDQSVLEHAIRAKFTKPTDVSAASGGSLTTPVSGLGWEYTKKIFQVPYWLPEVREEHLKALLKSMFGRKQISAEAKKLRDMVLPYLRHVTIEGLVNPREVKLFINAYIVQKAVDSDLEPGKALALLVFAFRPDWARLYSEILKDPERFQDALKKYNSGVREAFKVLSPQLEVLRPDSLAEFLDSEQAKPLAEGPLKGPLSSLQSTTRGGPWIPRALSIVDHMLAQLRQARAGHSEDPEEALAAGLEAVQDLAMEMEALLPSIEPLKVREAVRAVQETIENAEFVLEVPELDRARAEDALKELEQGIGWIRVFIWASLKT
jgi:hypothetical protein